MFSDAACAPPTVVIHSSEGAVGGESVSRIYTKCLLSCDSMTFKQRERAFYIGAPLAVIPALGFLPAVAFLVIVPKVAHAGVIAALLLPLLVASGGMGLWKLALGAVQKPFTLLNALSVGCLLVVLVIAGYTGLFLALLTTKL